MKAVSALINAESVELHRREADVLASLHPLVDAGLPVARLIGTVDQDGWVALVIEDLAGKQPTVPWTDAELELVMSAIDDLTELLTPAPNASSPTISARFEDAFSGWRTLASVAPPKTLDRWARDRLDELAALEAGWEEAAVGETLLHGDLRADNLLVVDDRIFVIDWPHACRGAGFVDLALFAPSVSMQGGPDPMTLLTMSRCTRSIDTSRLAPVVCAFAGYLTERSLQPPPAGLPTVRRFQAAQAEVARHWLASLIE